MKGEKSEILLKELERLLRRLSEIVSSDFAPLSNVQLSWKPDSKHWSIAECIQHLNIISHYYIPLLKAGLEKGQQKRWTAQPLYKSGRLGRYLIRGIQLKEDNRLRNRSRTPRAYRPSAPLNGQQVIQQYLDDQQTFLKLLEQAYQANLQKVRIPIAIFKLIRLRLGDMLCFLIYHNERHIVQAQRIFSEHQFPA